MAVLIDGKKVAEEIRKEQKIRLERLKKSVGYNPILAVIVVGDNKASQIYVRNKKKACEEVGIDSKVYTFEEKENLEVELIKTINELNKNKKVVGILVQLPLPKSINEKNVLDTIVPKKDVDGFSTENIGKLLIGDKGTVPCTPLGIIELLHRYNVSIEGKNCVVLGRSNIVGKPMSLLMLKENATVCMAHSRTKNLVSICKNADILISAIGKPKFITSEYIKDNAVVIDVGINRDDNGKLCGDVDMESVEGVVSMITPVPGGVGPMTVAMLIKNTIDNFEISVEEDNKNFEKISKMVIDFENTPRADELLFVRNVQKEFNLDRKNALRLIRDTKRKLRDLEI